MLLAKGLLVSIHFTNLPFFRVVMPKMQMCGGKKRSWRFFWYLKYITTSSAQINRGGSLKEKHYKSKNALACRMRAGCLWDKVICLVVRWHEGELLWFSCEVVSYVMLCDLMCWLCYLMWCDSLGCLMSRDGMRCDRMCAPEKSYYL